MRVTNLTKSYKDITVLKDVNMEIEKGKISFLLGKNGSGKTTLFKCLLNLEKYNGEVVISDSRFCIFDDVPFYDNFSGLDNIKYIAEYYGVKNYNINYELLDNKKLQKKVKTYSYGQRKKLGLQVIEILNPDVIIMDEASNGLDYDTLKVLKKKLLEWKNHKEILLSGHQLDFYNDIVDNIYLIKDSKIIKYDGEFENLGEIYERNL